MGCERSTYVFLLLLFFLFPRFVCVAQFADSTLGVSQCVCVSVCASAGVCVFSVYLCLVFLCVVVFTDSFAPPLFCILLHTRTFHTIAKMQALNCVSLLLLCSAFLRWELDGLIYNLVARTNGAFALALHLLGICECLREISFFLLFVSFVDVPT